MKQLFLGSVFVSAVLALSRWAFATRDSTKVVTGSEPDDPVASYEAIDAYVADQMRRLKVPGVSLAIVEGDKIVHLRGFGRARPGGEAPTPQTPFFIGSVTKSFTALAVMQLVEAGKIELDAPVQRYLPWFRVADPQASLQMTVRHLLNQTSGLPMMLGMANLSDFDCRPDATERQVRAFSSLEISRPVGSKFEYSNANYNVLGLIVESASGEAYPEYIQNHIFNPLEMKHSYTSEAMAKQDGLARGYRYWFGHPIPAHNLAIPLSSLPSGQIISCAEDMAHYLIAQLNGGHYGDVQILSAAGIDELHRGTAEMHEMGMEIGSYAMGWVNQVTGKSTIVSHGGIVPDFGAFAGLVREQKKGIVLLYNANHAMIKMTYDEFGLGAAQRLAGEVPSKTLFGGAPWLMRSMALVPVLQVVGVALTVRRLQGWRTDPARRPSGGRLWGQHILLPLIPNLLLALTLVPTMGKMRGWILLFMPDFSWIARICGGFAAVWVFLRTGLILQTLRNPQVLPARGRRQSYES